MKLSGYDPVRRAGRQSGGVALWCLRGLVAWLLWSVLGSMGPAPAQAKDPGSEEALRERVQGYWQAEVEKSYVDAYQLLAPEVRARLSLPAFVMGKRYLHIRGFTIEGVEANGDSALVRVGYHIEVELPPPPPGMQRSSKGPILKRGVRQEEWVREGGTWFRTIPLAR